MNNSVRTGVILIVAVLGLYIGLKFVAAVAMSILSLVIPLVIVGGVGLIIYGLLSRKPLGGGRRYLP